MTHKKNTYSEEIQSVFGNTASQKQVKNIGDTIQSLQKYFFPDTHFKASLLKQLENTYLVDEATEIKSHFSLLRVFSTVFSCIFLFLVGFVIYDIRHIPFPQETMISEDEASFQNMKRGVDDSGMSGEEYENIETITLENMEDRDFTPLSQEELRSEGNIQQGEDGLQIETQIETKTEVEFSISKQRYIQEEALPLNSDESIEEIPSEDLYQDTQGIDSTPSQDFGIESASMIAPMMMDIQDDFQFLCEQAAGYLSDDMQSCTLSDGSFCLREDMEMCFPQE